MAPAETASPEAAARDAAIQAEKRRYHLICAAVATMLDARLVECTPGFGMWYIFEWEAFSHFLPERAVYAAWHAALRLTVQAERIKQLEKLLSNGKNDRS